LQITIQPLPTGSPIQITGTKAVEGVSGGVLTHARLAEQIARIRAESVRFRDRRNISNTLAFSISREHATVGDAGLYWLTHAQSLPAACNVTFRVLQAGGSTFAEVTLPDAIVHASQGDWQGCSTTFNYTIQGGKFNT
jgi:hypothetical protein